MLFVGFRNSSLVRKCLGFAGKQHDKWRWGAEEEEHVQQIEKKPCRQQKYRQRTDKEANVSKDRLINDTIRIDGVKTNK